MDKLTELKELKARAYDLLAAIEYNQNELNNTNNEIRRLATQINADRQEITNEKDGMDEQNPDKKLEVKSNNRVK